MLSERMLTRGMPPYKMETNSQFTFLQEVNARIIIINNENLFERYLVSKRAQIKKLG